MEGLMEYAFQADEVKSTIQSNENITQKTPKVSFKNLGVL